MSNTLLSEQKRREMLEAYIQTRPEAACEAPLAVERPAGSLLPLTAAQKQLWLHNQLAPGMPLYNEPITVHRQGPLSTVTLEQSFNEIVRRHEAWR